MPKERVDVLAYKQGLFETREQAKRGVMAGLVVAVLNGERFDKPAITPRLACSLVSNKPCL